MPVDRCRQVADCQRGVFSEVSDDRADPARAVTLSRTGGPRQEPLKRCAKMTFGYFRLASTSEGSRLSADGASEPPQYGQMRKKLPSKPGGIELDLDLFESD